jgi:hypothetical protein
LAAVAGRLLAATDEGRKGFRRGGSCGRWSRIFGRAQQKVEGRPKGFGETAREVKRGLHLTLLNLFEVSGGNGRDARITHILGKEGLCPSFFLADRFDAKPERGLHRFDHYASPALKGDP